MNPFASYSDASSFPPRTQRRRHSRPRPATLAAALSHDIFQAAASVPGAWWNTSAFVDAFKTAAVEKGIDKAFALQLVHIRWESSFEKRKEWLVRVCPARFSIARCAL